MSQFSSVFETRTQTAFRWTVEELFEVSPRVYLWTFTFVDAIPTWWVGPTWQRLCNWITKRYAAAAGVRVYEWHREHGLHIHALVNVRIPVQQLRRYAKTLGFGRINVKRANIGAARYLAKYLGKDRGKIPHEGRSWAKFGCRGFAKNAIKFETVSLTQRKARASALRLDGVKAYRAWHIACAEEDRRFEYGVRLAHERHLLGVKRVPSVRVVGRVQYPCATRASVTVVQADFSLDIQTTRARSGLTNNE